MSRPAVFFNNNGTLVRPLTADLDLRRVELMPGALDAAQTLNRAGFALVVVANHSGIAHGSYSEEAVLDMSERVHQLLAQGGVPLDGYYFCPHHPGGTLSRYAISCLCRKPAPGLLIRAAQELDLDLRRSWMVGGPADVEAGHRVRLLTILHTNGIIPPHSPGLARDPDYLATSIVDAARTIRGVSSSYPFAAVPRGA